jgi:hypothetical protein
MCVCTNSFALNISKQFYKQKITIGRELAAVARAASPRLLAGTDHAGAHGPLNADFGPQAKISFVYERKKFLVRTLNQGW